MEGGKTRIYKQNLSRLIRLPDFFGITDSSGLTPLSRIWDNGIINNGPKESIQPEQADEKQKGKKKSVVQQLKQKSKPSHKKTAHKKSAEQEL